MRVEILRASEISRNLADLARLRIEVFAEWPYLYSGTLEYEEQYLADFARAPSSVLVIVQDAGRIVGASSAMALADEAPAIQRPFLEQKLAVGEWFYLAESVLKHEYRGRGLGHQFFDAREALGREQGFAKFAFCSVLREPEDPRRPAGHFDLDPFWRQRGYRPTELLAELAWLEHGGAHETRKPLRFWVKGELECLPR
jgi:GNAT superfamily N-acetyltransferase